MVYPEPSLSDHEAPWNMDIEENEDGEEVWVCSCTGCRNKKRGDWDDVKADAEYSRRKEERE